MSTPKVNTASKKLFINNLISPITSKENLADSDISSNEEYKSVRSSLSKDSLVNYNQKSIDNITYFADIDTKLKSMKYPVSVSTHKTYKINPPMNKFSDSNLRAVKLKNDGKLNNVYKANINMETPVTNLKLMNQKLKASYTSLKPMSTNLPVAPPITSTLNATKTLPRTKKSSENQNVESHTSVVEVSLNLHH